MLHCYPRTMVRPIGALIALSVALVSGKPVLRFDPDYVRIPFPSLHHPPVQLLADATILPSPRLRAL